MKRILFRVDGGQAMGMGHLSRCLALAYAAEKHAITVRFIVYGDEKAALLVKGAGFPVSLRPPVALTEQVDEVNEFGISDEVVILDFIHSRSLAELDAIPPLLEAWRSRSSQVVLVDGSADQALRSFLAVPNVDMILAPYAGEEAPNDVPFIPLFGPDYFIFAEAYQHLPVRITREIADRVLVTCGGSDPYEITEKVMSSLDLIERPLQIQVILGPLFEVEYKSELKKMAKCSHHTVAMIQAPANLAGAMVWCDVSVSTTGLTKYELAAAGAPMISLSIDEAHEEVNRAFLAGGTSITLGIHDEVTKMDVAQTVSDLLANPETRSRMASLGQKLVDGRGADRVLSAIYAYDQEVKNERNYQKEIK